jgi:branched-chain amino acid transport system permease protein
VALECACNERARWDSLGSQVPENRKRTANLEIVYQILIYGFINSSILVLMASGFALVYSISRVANFAHGALYIIAAYLDWVFINKLGINFLSAILLSIFIVGLMGAVMYRWFLIKVRGMPLSEIIASFAIGLGSLELIRFGGLKGIAYHLPPFVAGGVSLLGVSVDYHRIIIVGLAAVVVVFFWLFTHRTKVGLSLRGIAQDEHMAMMLGIDSDRAALVAFVLGSALAAFAASALVPLGTIAVEEGMEVLIYAIAICVLGGLGKWGGAIVGALIIGFAQTITSTLLGTQWQMVVALITILAILTLRPSGVFGKQKELEERV